MKLKKIVDRITELTNAKRKEQLEQCKQLKKILKQLRNKCKELDEKIAREKDPDKLKELTDKRLILATQRRKGLALLKELRS